MSVEKADDNGEFDGALVNVTVKNDGAVATDDVVQVYIKDEEFKDAVRNYSLCGFKRVSLGAGEEKTVEIKLNTRAFTSVDADGNREIFSKKFTIFAGLSQPDKRSEELTGHKVLSQAIEL
jgi:beta-glucosidase